MRAWKKGDLVWCRVLGYPKWPGQVMDPTTALKSVRAKGAPGEILVSFFGDDSYGWFEPKLVQDFEEGYEQNAGQKCSKAKVRSVFERAVEEGKELLDGRQGKSPATSHAPFDFLVDRVEYDAALVHMELDEQFKPLPDAAAAAMDASAAVAALRARARCPDGTDPGFGKVESLLVWHRFHTAPESVRRKTCARLADLKPPSASGKATAKRGRVSKDAAEAAARKDKRGSSKLTGEESDGKRSAKGRPGRKPKAEKGASTRAQGVRSQGKKLKAKSRASETASWASSDGSDHRGDAEAVSTDSDADGGHFDVHGLADTAPPKFTSAIQSLEAALEGQQVSALPEWAAAWPSQRQPRAKVPSDLSRWPDKVSRRVVADESERLHLTPVVPDEVPGLEERLAQADVQLSTTKVRVRKVLLRTRQFARNCDNRQTYKKVLNEHNIAALHKMAELSRSQPPDCEPDALRAAQCTRDVMLHAWRDRQLDACRTFEPDPTKPQTAWLRGKSADECRPELRFEQATEQACKAFVCLNESVDVPVHIYRHLDVMQPLQESNLRDKASAFWRARGLALPVCTHQAMLLDVASTMRQVALRGGFWSCTAAQGSGELEHTHENYIAWRAIAQGSWVGSCDKALQNISWIAADLQEFYRVWLLPVEQHIIACTADACTVKVAAGLLRRLAVADTQDGLLRLITRQLADFAKQDPHKLLALTAAPEQDSNVHAAYTLVGRALASRLGHEAAREMLCEFSPDVTNEQLQTRLPAPPPVREAAGTELSGHVAKAEQARAASSARAVSRSDGHLSGDSDNSEAGETIPGPRWARHKPRAAKKQTLEMLAEGSKQRAEAARASFLDVSTSDTTHKSVSKDDPPISARADQTSGDEKPKAAQLNPMKRQRRPGAAADVKASHASERRDTTELRCVQICFDPKFTMPTVAQIDLAVSSRFGPLDTNTSIAPVEKFMMLTFASAADARAAQPDLPGALRKHLQKHAGYAITATLMPISKGRQLVKDAALRRRRPTQAEPAVAAPDFWGTSAQPTQVPMHGALPTAPAAWALQQQQGAHGPMYTQGISAIGAAAPATGMQPGVAIGSAPAAPQQPLPAGFLHSMGPATASTAANSSPVAHAGAASEPEAETGLAATHMAAHSALPSQPPQPQPQPQQPQQPVALPDLNNLAAILQTATGHKGAAAPEGQTNAPEQEASSMLGLLQQLGQR